jgi:hypothetical protein
MQRETRCALRSGPAPMPDARYGYPARRMRVDEAARYVGLSVTAFRALGLPAVRINGTVGWLRDDLDAWLDARADRAAASEPAANPWHA